jgi:ubiquinone/menaquinone biosynthesis C-methylase UbiE
MIPNIYVQYGCGLSAPKEWINFDASPTLRIQKIPILKYIFQNKMNTFFPINVLYGNILKGLPIKAEICDGVYCSHVLEHLSLQDIRIALKNTYKILKSDGIFRCVVPDLEYYAREYIHSLEKGDYLAGNHFIFRNMQLSFEKRPTGFKELVSFLWGNSRHLWMWDSKSLSEELKNAGFSRIRICKFNDSEDKKFIHVESFDRFQNSIAFECKK